MDIKKEIDVRKSVFLLSLLVMLFAVASTNVLAKQAKPNIRDDVGWHRDNLGVRIEVTNGRGRGGGFWAAAVTLAK